MRSGRLLRTTSAMFVSAALLLSACSSGGGDNDGSGETEGRGRDAAPSGTRTPGGDAAPLAALPAEIPAELEPYYGQKLKWRECGAVGFECSRLTVPLDYEQPDPEAELRLMVSRKKADGGGKRIGSLMINPGGPGGSAVEYLQQAAAIGFPDELGERYDLVGMDPRGVADSEPIECLSSREMDAFTRIDQTPDSEAETDSLVEAYKGFAKGCAQRSGGLLGHVSTAEAARDMDVLRAALGDEKLYYYGASYGTFLGATYAGLYPKRTGRLVLDGAMDPSLSARELNLQQAAGFETAFTAFAEDCVRRSGCPLGTKSPEDAAKRLSAFFKKTDAKPLRTGESRTVTESQATTAVIQAMYAETLWPRLREALTAAMKGDGSDLLTLADAYYERGPDGSYGNIMSANPAVNCLDLPPAFSSPEEARKALPSFEKASSVFGRGFAWATLNCAYWQEEPTGEPHHIKAEDAAPMLVVGTTRDPATPYVWAEGLAGQLSTGRLLTFEGDGHTAFTSDSCIDSTITTYLLDGKAPKDGKRCP